MPAKIAHPFQPVDLNRDRCTVAACYAPSAAHPFVPFDDTANHHTGHHGLRAQELDGWTCRECTAESHIALAAELDELAGIPTTPELDALAAEPLDEDAVQELAAALGTPGEHFGPAPRIPVRPAGSLPDPYAEHVDLHAAVAVASPEAFARILWSALLTRANDDRRARARILDDGPTDDLALRACRWGLAPHAGHGGRVYGAEGVQARREASATFGAWRQQADYARRLAVAQRVDPGTHVPYDVTPSTWRGSDAASRDGGDERYNMTAAGGRWFYQLPPIYAEGSDTGAFETEQDAYAPIPD